MASLLSVNDDVFRDANDMIIDDVSEMAVTCQNTWCYVTMLDGGEGLVMITLNSQWEHCPGDHVWSSSILEVVRDMYKRSSSSSIGDREYSVPAVLVGQGPSVVCWDLRWPTTPVFWVWQWRCVPRAHRCPLNHDVLSPVWSCTEKVRWENLVSNTTCMVLSRFRCATWNIVHNCL